MKSPPFASAEVALVISLAGAACGNADLRMEDRNYYSFPDSLIAQVRVIASVELVEMQWIADSEPFLRIGDDSGGGAFKRLSHALRLPDGRFLGADAARGEVLLFDSDGHFLDAWGRPGQGSGEFKRPSWLGFCSGVVHAYDGGMRVVHVFALDGRYVRTFRPLIASGGVAHPLDPTRALACNGHGMMTAIATVGGLSGSDASRADQVRLGPYRPVDLVGVGDTEGGLSAIMQVAGEDRYRYRTGTGPLYVFGRKPFVAMSNDRLFVATGDEYEIASYAFRDKRWSLIRAADRSRLPIADSQIIDVKRVALSDPSLAKDARAALRRTMDAMTWPAFHPMIKGLLIDSHQCLWVREGYPTRPLSRWSVVTPEGRVLGIVDVPSRFQLMQEDAGELIGRERDGEGVDRIVVYRYHGRGNDRC